MSNFQTHWTKQPNGETPEPAEQGKLEKRVGNFWSLGLDPAKQRVSNRRGWSGVPAAGATARAVPFGGQSPGMAGPAHGAGVGEQRGSLCQR